jgi:glycosyltransferase involved in cell wall biosynthesis
MCRVATGEEGKGYHRLLELMPKLVERHPNLYWVLGGKGNDLENVRAKASELGVAAHCRFPGFIADDTLPDLYRSADFFILPSKKEGFGIVFLEAAATGLPVIAGNRDGSVDALANGLLGHLVDPENNHEIMEAITRVIEEPKRSRDELHAECSERFGKVAFRERLHRIITRYFE